MRPRAGRETYPAKGGQRARRPHDTPTLKCARASSLREPPPVGAWQASKGPRPGRAWSPPGMVGTEALTAVIGRSSEYLKRVSAPARQPAAAPATRSSAACPRRQGSATCMVDADAPTHGTAARLHADPSRGLCRAQGRAEPSTARPAELMNAPTRRGCSVGRAGASLEASRCSAVGTAVSHAARGRSRRARAVSPLS
jgi:hypothetical protein